MKKIKYLVAVLASVFAVSAFAPVEVLAAPFIMDDGVEFDAIYYYSEYPDVAASVGNRENDLYNHYKNVGKAEGRNAVDPGGRHFIWSADYTDKVTPIFQKIDGILTQITNPGMSDRDKVRAVTDWMCANITYDYDYASNGHRGGRDDYAAYVLEDGLAVCEGYANTFMMFMYRANIPCNYISGSAGGPHAWNRVKLDGHWYQIDVTWIDNNVESPTVFRANTDNLPEEYASRIQERIQQLNEEWSQKQENKYYLVDDNVGLENHYPNVYGELLIVNDLGELLDIID